VWETVHGMDFANQEGWVGLVGRSNGCGPCRIAELDEMFCQGCCFHKFKGKGTNSFIMCSCVGGHLLDPVC
jgi:hypothetical protein